MQLVRSVPMGSGSLEIRTDGAWVFGCRFRSIGRPIFGGGTISVRAAPGLLPACTCSIKYCTMHSEGTSPCKTK